MVVAQILQTRKGSSNSGTSTLVEHDKQITFPGISNVQVATAVKLPHFLQLC